MTNAEKPEEQITKPNIPGLLTGLMGWIEQRKESAQVPLNQTGKPWGWITGIVMVLAVVIGVAIMAWRAWKRGKEIAKLRHQVDVDQEAKHQAEVNTKLEENADFREALIESSQRLMARIEKTKDDIVKLESERRRIHSELNRVTSWEDVDALIERINHGTGSSRDSETE